jgi:histidine triad (HIT) family protein
MEDCIFCKIANGTIPSVKVHEDDEFVAFLDISPASKGHTLAVPKKHHETLIDMPPESLARYALFVKQAAEKITKKLNSDGFNVLMNNKPAAGQVVPHAHFHIIPRWDDDGLKFSWNPMKLSQEEMHAIAQRITGNDRD